MKVILKDQNHHILQIAKGEEVFSEIKKLMQAENILACTFFAIGACSEVELGFYNPFIKEYRIKPFVENLEIVSLLGNGAISEEGPILHSHGIFSRTDFTAIAGHVFKLTVSATCEVHLTKLEGKMERELDKETNLKLLK